VFCLSYSNTVLLLILHFRPLIIIIGIHFNIILFPFWTSKFFIILPRNIRTTLPSHRLLHLTILIPFGVNMQSSYVMFRFSLPRPSSSFKYSSQHSLRYNRHYPHLSNIERFPLRRNVTECIFWHKLIFPSCTCQCAWTNYGLNCQQKVAIELCDHRDMKNIFQVIHPRCNNNNNSNIY